MSPDHLADVLCADAWHEFLGVLFLLSQGAGWSGVFMYR